MHLYRLLKLFLILFMAVQLCACAGVRPNIVIPEKMPTPLTLKQTPRVALVLGAGGARGFAHAGAVKVLQNAGVPIDLIIGSSVGSFYGALLADSGNANIATKTMLSARFWDIADISNTPSILGAIQGYHYQKFLLKHMRARDFNQLKIPLVIVTTNLQTGKTLTITSGPIAPAAEASSAIPGVVKPSMLYGYTLIDGGMSDPIPVDIAKHYHPKVIIAINIASSLPSAMPWSALGVYERGSDIAWLSFSRRTEHGADVIIRPSVGDIGTFDVDKKYQLFHEGEVAAYDALPEIKRILREKHIALTHARTH